MCNVNLGEGFLTLHSCYLQEGFCCLLLAKGGNLPQQLLSFVGNPMVPVRLNKRVI
jgi:hypothetical protein